MYQSYIEKLLGIGIFRRSVALLLALELLVSSSAGFYASAMPDGEAVPEQSVQVQSEVCAADENGEPDESTNPTDPGTIQNITISKFDMDIISGYTRTEDGGYVWDANNSAAGHTFTFDILFQASGNGQIGTGEIRITIPASILNHKDMVEMSVPFIDDVTGELAELHDWAYTYDEDGNIVITNIKPIHSGNAFHFNVGYTTTEKTFEYEDMSFFDNFHAELDYTVNGEEREHLETDDIKVAIDTTASITQTNKKNPTELIMDWNPLWGEKPEYADDYYYLVWEVESTISDKLTQYYNFTLEDDADGFKCISPEGLDAGKLKIIGYNLAGTGNTYDSTNTVYGLDTTGKRHDYILTAIPREWYDSLKTDEEIVLENNVEAIVKPADGKDEPSSATARQTFTLKKPKFSAPLSNFKFDKNGNRRTYQLEQFTDPKDNSELTPFYYDVAVTGYSYDKTLDPDGAAAEGGKPEENYQNYGKKKMYFELTDNTVSLEGYMGKVRKDTPYAYQLKKDDYYFTSINLSYSINMVAKVNPDIDLSEPGNQSFNQEKQNFNLTRPYPYTGYKISFDIYGEYNIGGGYEYQKIATVKAYTTIDAVTFEPSMEAKAEITDISATGFTVNFLDEACTGYKIVTSDDYYYNVNFNVQPGIRLVKELDDTDLDNELQKWINEYYGTGAAATNKDRVTELRIINTANLECAAAKEDPTDPEEEKKRYYYGSASGTDYLNESTKESTIIKRYTSHLNNPLYKRYEINWSIDVAEYLVGTNTGEGNVPVVQYGGEFFDLLPKGSSVDLNTIHVYRQNAEEVEFTAKTSAGTDNRVLLRVAIAADQPGERYTVTFTTYHTWEDIAAFGSDILNPAAYVTGNEKMADTSNGGRGQYNAESMDLMVNSINSADEYTDIERAEDGSYFGETFDRAIFNDEPFDIKAVVMANVGVNKSAKNAKEGAYTTKTIVDETDRDYSYRLRLENGLSTRSIDNVLVDFLEQFEGGGVQSRWKGTLKSVDVSNLLSKNVIVRVYYSTEHFIVNESDVWYLSPENEKIKLVIGSSDKYYDAEGNACMGIRKFLPNGGYADPSGNAYWKLIDPKLCNENGSYTLADPDGNSLIEGLDLRDITAIIIDFAYADPALFQGKVEDVDADPDSSGNVNKNAKITPDNKYIMDAGEAAYVIVNMDNSGVRTPMTRSAYEAEHNTTEGYQAYLNSYNAHNNIFCASSMFNRTDTSKSAIDNWLEQNYTTVSYRIRKDFYAKKVNADDTDETIGGITFNLYGISDYGTRIDMNVTTTSNGILEFDSLELGSYTLVEVDCSWDWQIDRTEYTVTVNSDGTVTVSPDLNVADGVINDYKDINNPFVVTNKPRAHANIEFDKIMYDKGTPTTLGVEGAVFSLSGISDYGNPVTKLATSDYTGRVYFENVEQGTYELVEVEAPQGYARSGVKYEVRVDENNNWSITPKSETDLFQGDTINGYTIGNERYQEFYLQKQSKYGVGKDGRDFLLEGAVFHLSGTTDDGKPVDMTVTSGYSAAYGQGIAYFGKLEDGTYYLEEITAPVFTYTDDDGTEKKQEFYRDTTIYTVKIANNKVEITAPNDDSLPHSVTDTGEIIYEKLFTFVNVPIGGTVVVRKAWVDELTAEERVQQVADPDIVVSSEKPEPFENVYAYFDYVSNHSGGKSGKFGTSINNHKNAIKYFERYAGKVTAGEPYTENSIEYCNITVGGKEIKAEVISTSKDDKEHPSPVPIYGWMDGDTYKWYSEAVGAKILDVWDLFNGVAGLIDADLAGMNFSETTKFDYMFSKCANLENVYNLKRPANAVKATASKMFSECAKLGGNNKLIDLTGFDTTNITDMQMMFYGAIKDNRISDIVLDWGSALHTESVTRFNQMFDSCTKLKEIRATTEFNLDIATSFQLMFINCWTLVSMPSLTRKKTEMTTKLSMLQMFYHCQKLEKLDLSRFSTTGVTNMQQAFEDCPMLHNIDLSQFDTSEVTTMYRMFWDCKTFTELDISTFTTEKLETAYGMFAYCNTLVTIYASESFDLSERTDINTTEMFKMGVNNAPLTGGDGTHWNSGNENDGTYARIDGGTSKPGYFTLKQTTPRLTLSRSGGIAARLTRSVAAFAAKMLIKRYDADPEDTSPEAVEPTRSADDDFYRNSANHNNTSGPSGSCPQDHFFIVKTQKDAEKLKDKYPDIYELVKDVKEDEWLYVFVDIIGDELFVWEENVPEGYESDADNFKDDNGVHRIANVTGGSATVTNKSTSLKLGMLTLSKKVLDSETKKDVSDDVTKEFSFDITLSGMEAVSPQSLIALYYQTNDRENTEAERSVMFIEGKANVKIQSGYSLEFSNLPDGMKYTITEAADADTIQTTINGITSNDKTITGNIIGNQNVSVAYENTIEADVREKGDFTLEKRVDNTTGADTMDAEYSFYVEFTELVKNTEYSIYKGDTLVKTFTSEADKTAGCMVSLKAGDVLTFKDIPVGATYRITETASGAYISSYVIAATEESAANTAAGNELSTLWQTMDPDVDINIVFTNKIVKQQVLSVSKNVLDGGTGEFDPDHKYKFIAKFSNLGSGYQLISPTKGTFQADRDGNLDVIFELVSGETADFKNIPVGAVYSIYEDYNGILIPCSGVFCKDENTGELVANNSSTPSITTGEELAKAVEKAQTALNAAKNDYELALSVLNYDKKTLDAEIAAIKEILLQNGVTEERLKDFTADNFTAGDGSYQAARNQLLPNPLIDEEKLKQAESELEKAVGNYQAASDALAAAQEALEAARGASYVEGSIVPDQDTEINFANCKPFDLTINKEVTGVFGDLKREFRFKVVFKYNDIPFEGSYTATLEGGAKITDSNYQTEEDSDQTEDTSDPPEDNNDPVEDTSDPPEGNNDPSKDNSYQFDKGTVYFVLQHGGSITFKGLPCGTTYEIIEEEADDYEVRIDGTLSEDRIASGTIGPDVEVAYLNNWNGVIADLPGAGAGIGKKLIYTIGTIMLLEGITGALLLYRHKRRHDCA